MLPGGGEDDACYLKVDVGNPVAAASFMAYGFARNTRFFRESWKGFLETCDLVRARADVVSFMSGTYVSCKGQETRTDIMFSTKDTSVPFLDVPDIERRLSEICGEPSIELDSLFEKGNGRWLMLVVYSEGKKFTEYDTTEEVVPAINGDSNRKMFDVILIEKSDYVLSWCSLIYEDDGKKKDTCPSSPPGAVKSFPKFYLLKTLQPNSLTPEGVSVSRIPVVFGPVVAKNNQ